MRLRTFSKTTFIALFILYLFLSLFIYRDFVSSGVVSGGSENFVPTLDIFLKDLIWQPSWHEMLSKPTRGWLYSPHFLFYFIGKIIKLDVSTLIKLEYIIFIAISGLAMFLLIKYILLLNLLPRESEHNIPLSAFFSSLLYMLNLSFKIGDAPYIGMQISFAFFPFIIYFFLRAIYEGKFIFAIFAAFFWVESAVFDQRYLIAPIIIIVFYLIFFSLFYNSPLYISLKRGISVLAIMIFIFLLLGGYFFIALKSSFFVSTPTALTETSVDVTWSNASIINFLLRTSHFQLPRFIGNQESLINSSGIFLVLFAFSSLFFMKNNKILLFFLLLLVANLGLFVGFGIFSRKFLYWFVLESPAHHFLGRLFRTPRIPELIVLISMCILFSFSVKNILDFFEKKKIFRGLFILLLSFLIFSSSAPLFTGDIAGRLSIIKIPEGYYKINEKLLREKGYFKVIWTPEFWGPYQPYWSRGKHVDAMTYYGSAKPTYFARNNIMTHYYAYTLAFRYNSLLRRGQIEALYKFLRPLDFKYVILHNDIIQYRRIWEQVFTKLHNNSNFILIANYNPVYPFQVLKLPKIFDIYVGTILVYGGLETAKNLLYLSNLLSNLSLIFADSFKMDFMKRYTKNIVFSSFKNEKDLIFPFIKGSDLIVVSRYSNFYQENKWSRAYISDPHHGLWHIFIDHFPYQKWEFSNNLSTGFAIISQGKDKLEIPLKIKKEGYYLLCIRLLKSPKGGKIKINLSQFSKIISTVNQTSSEFTWVNIGRLYLKKGEYKLDVQNINGANAINLITLIPIKEYGKTRQKVEKLLQNKNIIYLLEAETDLYRGNVKIPDIIFENGSLLGTPKVIKDPKLSNGEGLEFYPDHKAWQTIEIVKEGYYRLGLRLKGEFAVKIGNYSFNMSSPLWDTKYTPPFYLKKGKYYLQITPKSNSPLLDVVYLFSVPNDKLNATLEDLFKVKEPPAQIKEYKKINPTLWKVKVNAQKPFMLSFAEAYDPLWEARIYKNGKKIKTVRSLPLYAVINGFWIDETGDLDIVIRYKPQDWFEIGLAISALTFLACIGYLVYDWRRDGRRATQNHRNYSNF